MKNIDFIIIGSGPSGVSAAFPLVKAGLKVVMIDGGKQPSSMIPNGHYYHNRTKDEDQWKYLLGDDFESILEDKTENPKLRVPRNTFATQDFLDELNIKTKNFQAIGSLATGGLSNLWGATVASFNDSDFIGTSMEGVNLTPNYQTIAKRIGISGDSKDHLSNFFGNEYNFKASPPLDHIFQTFFSNYKENPKKAQRLGINFGRSRNAILTEDLDNRKSCELCGMCMYGCRRDSIYNSTFDIDKLKKFPNFTFLPGYIAKSILRGGKLNELKVKDLNKKSLKSIESKSIILASGPFSTMKIILESLKLYDKVIPFFSNPISLFALLFPFSIGSKAEEKNYNFGQLAFLMKTSYKAENRENFNLESFGVMYDVSGIPVWELLKKVPFTTKNIRKSLRYLLPAMRVGNCYLPGNFSNHELKLSKNGELSIKGSFSPENEKIMKLVSKKLKQTFRHYGAFVLPGSFRQSIPGSDIHYGGAAPHSLNPEMYETKLNGEVMGLREVYIVDASVLPKIPTKPYTFTIMANADRIAKGLLTKK